jgi:hypothetical protein
MNKAIRCGFMIVMILGWSSIVMSYDSVLKFDGLNDYVEIGDNPSFRFGAENFSYGAWVKTTSSQRIRVIDKMQIQPPWIGFEMLIDGSKAQAGIYDGVRYVICTGMSNIADGKWHFLAAVVNHDGNLQIFVDGRLENQVSLSAIGSINNSIPLAIGRSMNYNGQYFKGNIDDVQIWNIALTQQQIQELMHTTLLGSESELVAYWNFDEGSGQVIHDLSSNQNNGRLGSTPNQDENDPQWVTMVSLEIVGPDSVAANSTAQFQAIAHYDDGTTDDMATMMKWSVTPDNYGDIDSGGILTTGDVLLHENIIISALYDKGDVSLEVNKTVIIFSVCPSGYALQFDGVNDCVIIPANVSETNYTLSLWFKTLDPNSGIIAITRGLNSHDRDIYLNNGNLYTRLWQEQSIGTTGQNYADGRWHNVAHIFGTAVNGQKLYVDGIEMARGTKSISDFNFEEEIRIGWSKFASHNYFSGMIDDLRIWNRSLSSEEIQSNMHIPLSDGTPDLYGYWNFDEDQGQIIQDASGNCHQGYLGLSSDIDDSDPRWVVSDAPMGVCSPYLIAVQNLNAARKEKLVLLDAIDAATEKEKKAIAAMGLMLAGEDRGELPTRGVIQARNETRVAIVQQKIATFSVQRSIRRLERALGHLSYDVPIHDWSVDIESAAVNPADINADGVVNVLDLSILYENWLIQLQP